MIEAVNRVFETPMVGRSVQKRFERLVLRACVGQERGFGHCQVEENSVDGAPRYCRSVRPRTQRNVHEFRVRARNLTMPERTRRGKLCQTCQCRAITYRDLVELARAFARHCSMGA
jgi:hypothetical protein